MRFMTQGKRWLLTITASCIVMFAASCTNNLTAVREWSKTSLEATQYNELVDTYADTPARLKRYHNSGLWDVQIAMRMKQAEALKQILSVVTDYMGALTTLSADGTVAYSKDVNTLTDRIRKLDTGISGNTLGAVGSLGNTLLKAYQSKQVANIVGEANDPLQAILKGELREIINRDFRADLETEKVYIGSYYDHLLNKGHTSEAAKVALMEWKEMRLEQNARRMQAVAAYLKVLDKVSEGHQKLYENRKQLDKKTLIKDLFSLANELRQQIKILTQS